MIEALKWQIRSWEEAGRHGWLTGAATASWVGMQNLRDRQFIGRVNDSLTEGRVPATPAGAVAAVCDGSFGAGIRPMQAPDELTDLIERVAERRPKKVLEIGTARGGTLFLLCRFAAPDASITSVDLPCGRNGGGYPRWKERHYRSFAGPDQNLRLLRADSHAAETVTQVSDIAGEDGFDFILIDADHSYDGVKCDYGNYFPLLAPSGLLVLHDVVANTSDPSIDVARFWAELEADPEISTETIISDRDLGAYGFGLVSRLDAATTGGRPGLADECRSGRA